INGDNNYITILKNIKMQWSMAVNSFRTKYIRNNDVKSQWGGNFIIGLFVIIIFYAILASLLNILLIRFLLPVLSRKKLLPESFSSDEFYKKRTCIILASTVITFAILLAIVTALLSQNFIIMASGLLVEYAWLLGVILVSLLIRLDGDQIKSGFKVYMPITVMGAVVIVIRIILIPNIIVNLIFPPILIVFTLWQWHTLRKVEHNLKREDRTYSWITLFVFIFSVVSSWIGFTLMSVQAIIWWIMQLTCILTITFLYKLLVSYGKRHFGPKAPITATWFYGLLKTVVLPVLGVVSILISIYWAAEVFELTDICWSLFKKNFVNLPNLHVSLFNLVQVLSLYFLFKYVLNVARRMLELHFDKKNSQGMERNKVVMGTNALKILIWGIYILLVMSILGVGNTWLVVISTGLATGVGFASKDILENIYYGISLMAGRIHIGDMIEIDGIRGKVDDMNYTSTLIEATDGSVIAFQNSQLFTKNYKNLTKNHGWELITLPRASSSMVLMTLLPRWNPRGISLSTRIVA
ncbi:MAG: mechanosensitive ion channel, partial [Prevotellaceae bacterium]|nr:mechanosensitive ion channel [Prevotellaceae bacterium]